MEHCTTIHQLGEGGVQAVCSCGWRSPVFGSDKVTGTMDPLQHAAEAADLHEREMSLRERYRSRGRTSLRRSAT